MRSYRFQFAYIYILSLTSINGISQSHEIYLSGALHHNVKDFYQPELAYEYIAFDDLPLDYSTGIGYHFYFNKRGLGLFLLSDVNYSFRTNKYYFIEDDRYSLEDRSKYLDLTIGVGYIWHLVDEWSLATSFKIGNGIPLLKSSTPIVNDKTTIIYSSQHLPFLETNLSLKYIVYRRRGTQFSLSFMPFLRTYLIPLYEDNEVTNWSPPYLGGGINFQFNLLKY